MHKLQSILLATDFRPASREAVQAAVRLAPAFASRVTLLHVLEPMPGWPVALHMQQKEMTGPLQEVTRELADGNVTVAESLIVTGPPADTIIRKAQEIDADLILIGAGERSRFDRFSVGPTAAAVIAHALQPVLAVRPGEPTARFQTLLCPVDQSGASARGLRNAIQLARATGGRVLALTVVPAVSHLTAAVDTGQWSDAQAEFGRKWAREFDEFVAGVPAQGVTVTKEVRHGTPHQQIVAAAQDHQADLIVMGSTGWTGLARVLLGSTTRRVLEQLPCSLLTVKQEDMVEERLVDELRQIRLLMAEGRELAAAGSYELARAKFRQVLGHDPFHAEATAALAEAHERLGQLDLASYYRGRAARLQEASSEVL